MEVEQCLPHVSAFPDAPFGHMATSQPVGTSSWPHPLPRASGGSGALFHCHVLLHLPCLSTAWPLLRGLGILRPLSDHAVLPSDLVCAFTHVSRAHLFGPIFR